MSLRHQILRQIPVILSEYGINPDYYELVSLKINEEFCTANAYFRHVKDRAVKLDLLNLIYHSNHNLYMWDNPRFN